MGTVVIKCIGHVEARKDVSFEQVKPELLKEALDKKVTVEVTPVNDDQSVMQVLGA